MFGATAAAMHVFKMYGNDFSMAIDAVLDAWYNAYPIEGEKYGMTAEADAFITDEYLYGVGYRVCYEYNL